MIDKKDKALIEKAEKENIPIFVLIATDVLAPDLINTYALISNEIGCSKEHQAGAMERCNEFHSWQGEHPDKVKKPD